MIRCGYSGFSTTALRARYGAILINNWQAGGPFKEQDFADAHFRLANTTIEHLHWCEVVRRYDRPHTLFYCDPPYWQVEGYGVGFPWEEYEALARMAGEIEGQMIISINDHPDIRALFDGWPVVEIDHKYTVGGGGNEQRCVELVYGTWPGGIPKPRAMQPDLFG